MRDGRRHAPLVEHGDHRFADRQLWQQLLEVVVLRLRVRAHGGPQRFRVVGRVRAQRVLDTAPELREHVRVHVLRRLGDEEHADALRADEPRRADHRLDERLRRILEQQVGLVEEEDELRLRQVADLGQRLEQLAEQPHRRRRPEQGLVPHVAQLEQRDHAAAVRVDAYQVVDVELRLAEELGAAAVLDLHERAQQHADRRGRDAADPLQLGAAFAGVEELEHRAKVGEVDERQPFLIRVVEKERKALLLGLVRVEDLREQERPEVGDRDADRRAGAKPAERVVLDGKRLRLERLAERFQPLLHPRALVALRR